MPYLLVENEKITAWYSDKIAKENLTSEQSMVYAPDDRDLNYLLGKNIAELNAMSQTLPINLPTNKEIKQSLRYQLKELYLEREFAEAIDEDTSKIVAEFSSLLGEYNNIKE